MMAVDERQGRAVKQQPRDEVAPLPTQALTWRDKLGLWAILFLSIGTVFLLAAFGFLCFLWLGNQENTFWRKVTASNWLVTAVTICAEVIKQTIGFQIGVAVAMTAALALETSQALYPTVASLAVMRATAGSGTVLSLLWQYLSAAFTPVARSRQSGWLFLLVVLLACVYGVTQVFSILLISDIGPSAISGVSSLANTSYGFNNMDSYYNYTEITSDAWLRVAGFYPTFGEYSEPPYIASGVSDTGVTLRSFLPFPGVQSRESLQGYVGASTVMDFRVSCQIPNLTGETISANTTSDSTPTFDMIGLQGAVTPSRYTPRLANVTYDGNFSRVAPFQCAVPYYSPDESNWLLSICQLPGQPTEDEDLPFSLSGALVPEFVNISTLAGNSLTSGISYLVLNTSLGTQTQWKQALGTTWGKSFSPTAYEQRGEWLDLVFNGGDLVLSATLCYTGLAAAELPIALASTANRTEPAVQFNASSATYSFGSLRAQYGQDAGLTPAQRGVLVMANQSWVSPPDGMETFLNPSNGFGRDATSYFLTTTYNSGTVVGKIETPNLMHVWFVQEILQTGGSVAFALQSVLTLLASMAYYDNLGNFNKEAEVELTFFVLANVTLFFRGFLTVAAVIALHVVLMVVTIILFLTRTRLSQLGATWAALAQMLRGDAVHYLQGRDAAKNSDGDILNAMKKNGDIATLVGIREVAGEVGVFMRDDSSLARRSAG